MCSYIGLQVCNFQSKYFKASALGKENPFFGVGGQFDPPRFYHVGWSDFLINLTVEMASVLLENSKKEH